MLLGNLIFTDPSSGLHFQSVLPSLANTNDTWKDNGPRQRNSQLMSNLPKGCDQIKDFIQKPLLVSGKAA